MDPEVGESYEVLQGVDWPQITLQQATVALETIEAAMEPADERSLGALLYEVWIATAKPSTATADQQALSAVYIRELRDWPADIALHVLRQAKRTCHWFPPLADLCQQCTALARKRQWLLASLQDRIAELERPALAAPIVPTPRPMPGSERAEPPFWSPCGGNVEILAEHLGCTYRQARERLLQASNVELAEHEAAVRRLKVESGQ